MKNYKYCFICDCLLIKNDNDKKASHHHINYIENIYIVVCNHCHSKLHSTLSNHKFGVNNIIGFKGFPGHNGYLFHEQRIKRKIGVKI